MTARRWKGMKRSRSGREARARIVDVDGGYQLFVGVDMEEENRFVGEALNAVLIASGLRWRSGSPPARWSAGASRGGWKRSMRRPAGYARQAGYTRAAHLLR
jgi:hypothetical protein